MFALAGVVLAFLFASVVSRLTNSGCGATDVLAVDPDPEPEPDPEPVPEPDPDPDPDPEDAPFDPSTVCTDVIRCEPGRNTICPSVTVPVCD